MLAAYNGMAPTTVKDFKYCVIDLDKLLGK